MTSPFVKLTPFRASILSLAQQQGPISADDVADDAGKPTNNALKINANKQLRALHEMKLLAPTGECEYILTTLGQQWLDNRAAAT